MQELLALLDSPLNKAGKLQVRFVRRAGRGVGQLLFVLVALGVSSLVAFVGCVFRVADWFVCMSFCTFVLVALLFYVIPCCPRPPSIA